MSDPQISLETTLRFFWFDTRLKPRLDAMQVFFRTFVNLHFFCQTFFQGKDSFGDYVNLHPRVANSIWMPDIFIDQVNPIELKYNGKCKKKVDRKI